MLWRRAGECGAKTTVALLFLPMLDSISWFTCYIIFGFTLRNLLNNNKPIDSLINRPESFLKLVLKLACTVREEDNSNISVDPGSPCRLRTWRSLYEWHYLSYQLYLLWSINFIHQVFLQICIILILYAAMWKTETAAILDCRRAAISFPCTTRK